MSPLEPVATIVVPTHDHAATLDVAVRSALGQTVANIEVIVVGDGVGDDTRDLMSQLGREDPRVRFLDLPKGPNHGEIYRGHALESSTAEIACYLCDDDLLLPEHVESMRELLVEADLAQSLDGYINATGSWRSYFGDLSSPECRTLMLQPDRNVISLTGTAHTVSAYRRLPHGWRTTPPGRWPDHYMWQQFLAQPWLRAATSPRVTALQFPTHYEGRAEWTPEARRDELLAWRDALAGREGRARFDRDIRRALVAESAAQNVARITFELQVLQRNERIEELEARIVDLDQARSHFEARAHSAEEARSHFEARVQDAAAAQARADAEVATAAKTVVTMASTRTWRWRARLLRLAPVRALARATARRHA